MAIVSKALQGMGLYRRNRRRCSWLRDRIIPSFGVDDLAEIHVCDLVSHDQTKRALPQATSDSNCLLTWCSSDNRCAYSLAVQQPSTVRGNDATAVAQTEFRQTKDSETTRTRGSRKGR
jgi:hypothetical protein